MECSNILEAALAKGNIGQSLFKGSEETELIKDLQRVLFELGFKTELKLNSYQADGDYGPSTVKAVIAFAHKNGITTDGLAVSDKLTRIIVQRHDFLPEMYILWSIFTSDLRTRYYISKGSQVSITAIQLLLNELGYGDLLNFPKYGADGLYGNSTRKAVIAFASNHDITSDGDLLTRPLVNLLIKSINPFYWNHWEDLAEQNLPNDDSPLILFTGSRFKGKPCRADIQFKPFLEQINTYAESAGVFVYITSSFRTSSNVNGAIVTPAKRSNHMAGHGIDMNIIYGNNGWANSRVLNRYPEIPEPARIFIRSIIDDPRLRWGGTFTIKDSVHIDDGLNKDMGKWKKRYMAMQKAVQLGS